MDRTPARRCTVVPPYLLSRLAEMDAREGVRAADPALVAAVAEPARRTLLADAAMLAERGQRANEDLGPVEPGAQRTISDSGNREELPGAVVRREGGPATGDAAADEAYAGLGDTYDLYLRAFGRESLDGAGRPLLASVHYGRGYDNAFWDGAQMVFGDGDGRIFGRFTASVSVIGHELTHGVTQYTANLAYEGQSGALNEHVSDVFGALVEQFSRGQSSSEASWLIGEGLFTAQVRGEALRSMKAPGTAYDDPVLGRDPQPATFADYVETTDDNGGVHLNSGIPNRAFFVTATTLGGDARERAGQIWYDTLTGPLAPGAGFADFARATLSAAGERYGSASTEVDAVAAGWDDVGVAPAPGR